MGSTPNDLETLFRVALQASPAGTLVIDTEGQIVLANAEAARLFGYSLADLQQQSVENLIPSRFRHNHRALRHHYAGHASLRQMGAGRDLHAVRQDGSEFPVEIGLNPVTAGTGQYVIATVIDLTARRQAEELFRVTVEASPAAMIVVDAKGTIVLANTEALRLFGYEREELLDQPIEQLVPERDRHLHAGLRIQYIAHASTRAMGAGRELRGLRKDGSEFPLEIGLNPVQTSAGARIIAAITDLSARHAAEELRRQVASAQAHLAAIIESSDDAIISTDCKGIITSWNAGASKLFGYSADECIGHSIERMIPPEALNDARALRDSIIEQNQAIHKYDVIERTRDGQAIHVSMTLSPILDGNGTVTGISKVARDVSEQVRIEQTLRERSAQLAQSNAELQQFANSASHDLQEPLRAIAGCVDLLRRRYAGHIDAKADEFIGHAVDSTVRMKQLINDLLLIAQVDSSKALTEQVDCNEALRSALLNLSTAVDESSACVTSDTLPHVVGDNTQLTQLFQNLIGNAIKFRGQQAPRIAVSYIPEPAHHHFCVSDNGIGIEPQHLERVFGLFERLHSRKAYPGTGIGLALCAKIVAAHRGTLWVESTFGQGSTFHFRIPVAPITSTATEQAD